MRKCELDLQSFYGNPIALGSNDLIQYESTIMKNIKIATAAVVLSALSFGVFAATPATTAANHNEVSHVAMVEAGSNIAPGAQSTGRSTDDAFNVHTLVAGEWY